MTVDNKILPADPAADLATDFRHSPVHLFPANPETSELTVACPRRDYSASLIARAVEDADAHLLNLNVTSTSDPEGLIWVDLRVSHRNAGAVSRSLERYGYEVRAIHSGFDPQADIARSRLSNLLARLDP